MSDEADDFDAWIAREAAKARPDTYGKGNDFGAVVPATMDVNHRPYVLNRDGSHSSMFSESSGPEGGEQMLYPRVSDAGKFMSSDEAYNQAKSTGKHMGIYRNADEADSGAQAFHDWNDANPSARTKSVYSGLYPDDLGANGAENKVPEMTHEELDAWLASHR